MRNKLRRAAVIGVMVVMLSACVDDPRLQLSLNPLWPDDAAALPAGVCMTFDAALLGVWTNEEDPDQTWTVTHVSNSGGDSYEVEISVGERRVKLGAWLVQLDDTLFISFFPVDLFDSHHQSSPFYWAHLVGMFSFGVLSADENTVQLRMLDSEWTKTAAKDGTLQIAHVVRWEHVLLSASSEDLREFARLYAHDEQAFGAVTTLTRAEATGPR